MYVCMYVCIYVCMHACTYISIYICMLFRKFMATSSPEQQQSVVDSRPPQVKWPNRREDYELLEVIGK